MSREIWITSDTHFGHSNIIKYCDRPFKNHEFMDEALVENWNSVVKDGDIVYHLGDVWMGNKGYINLYNLKGRKRLILGNHDNGKDNHLLQNFQKIFMWRLFPEFGLMLTHVPVHESSMRLGDPKKHKKDIKILNVHGHIHNQKAPTENHRCVCVEHTNYTPINIEEIRIK